MKCRCGVEATYTRRAPWAASGVEGACDRCADRITAGLNKRQAELDRQRPQRIKEAS